MDGRPNPRIKAALSRIVQENGRSCVYVVARLSTFAALWRFIFLISGILYTCQGIAVTSIMAYMGPASTSVTRTRTRCTEWENAMGSSAVTMATPINE